MLGLAPLNRKFWAWFGRSLVRHADNTPMVVYHGTRSPRDFRAFETGTIFDRKGNLLIAGSDDPGAYIGPHFTMDPDVASRFASGTAASWDRTRVVEHGRAGGRVIPVYLRIESPAVFDSDEEMIEFIFRNGHSHLLEDELEQMREDGNYPDDVDPDEWVPELEDYEQAFHRIRGYDTGDEGRPVEEVAADLGGSIRDLLERQGHDGIIYRNTIEGGGLSFIVFDAPQIKSAIGNRGTWSRRRRDIRE